MPRARVRAAALKFKFWLHIPGSNHITVRYNLLCWAKNSACGQQHGKRYVLALLNIFTESKDNNGIKTWKILLIMFAVKVGHLTLGLLTELLQTSPIHLIPP